MSSALGYKKASEFRYSTVRPLSTLNYTTDMFNNSSIVSGIEFDKVRLYFY
jgi:E3 ubiquitin-protein ligase RFWD2